jgi:hypothetical protein
MSKRLVAVFVGAVVLAGIAIAAGQAKSKSDVTPAVEGPARESLAKNATVPVAPQRPEGAGLGMPAIEKARQNKKYLFALFWKEKDEQAAALKSVFERAVAKVADRADSVVVDVTEPAEGPIVDKFELDRAPMPLVLVLAPNGAITGGFPKKFEEKDLLDAFATPCCERCMKALQDKKLVFVCVQNEATTSNAAAMQGVRDFQADPQYREVTEVVTLNPADKAEAPFLADLKISSKTADAVTALLAPPGAVVAQFKGQTTKKDLVASLQKSSSGCCPGGSCGPEGCAPKDKP